MVGLLDPRPLANADDVGIALEEHQDTDAIRFGLNSGMAEGEDPGPLRPGTPIRVQFVLLAAGGMVNLVFGTEARMVQIANASGGTITRDYLDDAGPGSWPVANGASLSEDVRADHVSIYSPNAAQINGAVAGIRVEAYA